MKRYQIYPSNELDEIITKEASRKGISISAEIIEKLEAAYGMVNVNEPIVFSEIMATIQEEVEEYVASWMKDNSSCDKSFTLYKASKTFADISMVDASKRLVSMKPRIGKAFRSLVDNGKIANVVPLKKANGEQKREHNAAMYTITKEE